MKVVGIVLVMNEDRFIEAALRNIVDFCDEILVADDYRTRDRTGEIVKRLAVEYPHIQYRRTLRNSTSHEMIQSYAGTDTWIFAVDGDEIYDPEGLMRFRPRLEAGEFDRWWCLFGNVLNCIHLDEQTGAAEGFLAPPSRSMTKLYNFSAIDAWEGPCVERLHGGQLRFRPGYDASLRNNLHEQVRWEDADYRCLHTCFLRRSSLDADGPGLRLNIMDRQARSWWRRKLGINKGYVPWKFRKYRRGKPVRVEAGAFFARSKGL